VSRQHVESSVPSCLVATRAAPGSVVVQRTHRRPAAGQSDSLSTEAPYPGTRECDAVPITDVIDDSVCLSDEGIPEDHKSSVSGPENRSVYGDADMAVTDLPTAAPRDRELSEQEPCALSTEGTRGYEEGQSGHKEEKLIGPSAYSSGPEDAGGRWTEEAAEDTRQADTAPEDREETDETIAGQETERMDVEEEGEEEGEEEEKGLGSLAHRPEAEIGCTLASGDSARGDGERSDALQDVDPVGRTEAPLSASQPSASPPPPEVATGIHADTGDVAAESCDAAARTAPTAAQHPSCGHESGGLRRDSGGEVNGASGEQSGACTLNVQLEHVNQSPTGCFPSSCTPPDCPRSNSTACPVQSDPQHIVKHNGSNVDDGSKNSKEMGGRCEEPEYQQSLAIVTRVVQTPPPNQENSDVGSTSKDSSSSERSGSQIPARPTDEADDVKDKTVRDAPPPDDPRRAVIVDRVQALPASSLCSVPLPGEDAKDAKNVKTTAGDAEPQQHRVSQAEAAQTEVVDVPPGERVLKPGPPHDESPLKAPHSGYGPGDEEGLPDPSALCGAKKYRSSLEWGSFQRKRVLQVSFEAAPIL